MGRFHYASPMRPLITVITTLVLIAALTGLSALVLGICYGVKRLITGR